MNDRAWAAGLTFGLGVLSGLYLAHEAGQETAFYTATQLETAVQEQSLCSQHLEEATVVLGAQQEILTKQLKLLEEVCPIVRRALVGWPYCPPQEVPIGAR